MLWNNTSKIFQANYTAKAKTTASAASVFDMELTWTNYDKYAEAPGHCHWFLTVLFKAPTLWCHFWQSNWRMVSLLQYVAICCNHVNHTPVMCQSCAHIDANLRPWRQGPFAIPGDGVVSTTTSAMDAARPVPCPFLRSSFEAAAHHRDLFAPTNPRGINIGYIGYIWACPTPGFLCGIPWETNYNWGCKKQKVEHAQRSKLSITRGNATNNSKVGSRCVQLAQNLERATSWAVRMYTNLWGTFEKVRQLHTNEEYLFHLLAGSTVFYCVL